MDLITRRQAERILLQKQVRHLEAQEAEPAPPALLPTHPVVSLQAATGHPGELLEGKGGERETNSSGRTQNSRLHCQKY